MAPVSFGSVTPPIGLDIGTDHVRAVQVRPSSANPVLASYGSIVMPYGAVVEGEIIDAEAVAGALRDLWRTAGFRSKEVAVGVSNQKVVVRLIDLPFMEKNELAGAIQYQAQDYIPIPIDEAILSHEVIGDYVTSADEHMMEVLLVAAQRDMIDGLVRAVEGAGLKLMQIDVTAFALVRSLLGTPASLFPEDSDDTEAVGLIHISSGITNIAVVESGVTRFTRVSSQAGSQFTQAVSSVLNLTFDEAETLKMQVGLPSLDGSAAPALAGSDPAAVAMAQEALEREANKFIGEVRRSLDYYLTQASQVRTIKRIVLTGSGAALRNFPAYLANGLQTEVVIGDPLSHVQLASNVEQAVTADRLGIAPAIGLALGGLE